jgi:hypothetical protein
MQSIPLLQKDSQFSEDRFPYYRIQSFRDYRARVMYSVLIEKPLSIFSICNIEDIESAEVSRL